MRKGFLIAAAVLFPLCVYAEGDTSNVSGSETTEQAFKSLDTNHDGYISQKEAKSNPELSKDWDSADANSDGRVEKSEFSAFEAGTAATFVPQEDYDEPGIGAAPTQ